MEGWTGRGKDYWKEKDVMSLSAFDRQNLAPCLALPCRLPTIPTQTILTLGVPQSSPLTTVFLPPSHQQALYHRHSSTTFTVTSHTASCAPPVERHQKPRRPIGSSARHNTTNSQATFRPSCRHNRSSARWQLSAADLSVRFSTHLSLSYNPYHHQYYPPTL